MSHPYTTPPQPDCLNICHLADAFIQSYLQACVYIFYVQVVQGIKPTIVAFTRARLYPLRRTISMTVESNGQQQDGKGSSLWSALWSAAHTDCGSTYESTNSWASVFSHLNYQNDPWLQGEKWNCSIIYENKCVMQSILNGTNIYR